MAPHPVTPHSGTRRPVTQRPLLPQIPLAMRRVAGLSLLTVTLWLAAFLALIR